MFRLLKTFAALCAIGSVSAALSAEPAPIGAWRTTNNCFLAAFLLTEDGRAQTAYATGEQDDKAAWSWDGKTLKIMSQTFDLDSFSGRVAEGAIEADYVWHDLDKDELHSQSCSFEKFKPFGI